MSPQSELAARTVAAWKQTEAGIACQESVKNSVETRVFWRLQRLGSDTGRDVNRYQIIVKTTSESVLKTCKIAKLSFVAGAEIPKRYLRA
jgi:hypothetical protein